MNARFAPLEASCDHKSLFALTYLRTAEQYRSVVVQPGFFSEPNFINLQDANFARLYFDAWDAYRAGSLRAVPRAWQLAFQAADRGRHAARPLLRRPRLSPCYDARRGDLRMAFSRRLGVVGMLGGLWLVAVGCDDSGDKKVVSSEGGEGGEATTGGKSAGGSSNNAGKAGAMTAGTGGTTAGTGGTTAGMAGMGISGDAGAGQAGGADVAGGAGGAAAGGAGGAGVTPPAGALSCGFSCEVDGDCVLASSNDTTYRCNSTTHRCEDRTAACETHTECPAIFWTAGCTINDDCGAGEACVAFRGTGFCAPVPVDGCGSDIQLTLPLVDGGTAQAVCGSGDSRCISGACQIGCAFFFGCAGPGEVCDETSGVCSCATGPDCDSGVCTDGHCAPAPCATSDDCTADADQTGLDVCVEGKCGCSSAPTCVDPGFAGVTKVCE